MHIQREIQIAFTYSISLLRRERHRGRLNAENIFSQCTMHNAINPLECYELSLGYYLVKRVTQKYACFSS